LSATSSASLRGSDQRPERHPRRGSGGDPNAAAQAEDRIEHVADRAGERPAIDHRDRRTDAVAASEEARAIGFELAGADLLALDDRQVHRPGRGIGRRAGPACRQQRAHFGSELRAHEQLREGGMGEVGRGGCEHELRVRGELDLARPAAEIRDRNAPDFPVVLR
jgi:hypothetical protein